MCVTGEFIIQTCDWQGSGQQESGDDPTKSSYLLGTSRPICWLVKATFHVGHDGIAEYHVESVLM